jgi:hypothetical protein
MEIHHHGLSNDTENKQKKKKTEDNQTRIMIELLQRVGR